MLRLLIILFMILAMPIAPHEAAARNVSVFPPEGCINGAVNIVVWNGEGTNTRCMQILTLPLSGYPV